MVYLAKSNELRILQILTAFSLSGAIFPTLHAQTPTYSVLYTFPGYSQPGYLFQDQQGVLYGVTNLGGNYTNCGYWGCGAVFQFDPATQTFAWLHSFDAADGQYPVGAVIQDSEGHLYGATGLGGTYSQGTIFGLNSAGETTFLYSLNPNQGGYRPFSGVVGDGQRNLYGATAWGGTDGGGVVFQISSTGTFTVLHNFSGSPSDGSDPYAPLLRDRQGNLYGTTISGGSANDGTVFKVASDGTETVLHSFSGIDGLQPSSGLTVDAEGNFYGVTSAGGTGGHGVVFKLDPMGTLTVLYSFTGARDGGTPFGSLYLDSATGNLFGTASSGGTPGGNCNAGGCGLAFAVTPQGKELIVHAFEGNGEGSAPGAGLIGHREPGVGLELFGTTEPLAGSAGGAIIFELAIPPDSQ